MLPDWGQAFLLPKVYPPENFVLTGGFFIEMFLTFQLMLMIFMLGVEKHKATFLAPVGIGLTLFVCHVAGIYFTGSSLNPARSFGPDLVTLKFTGYHWIYCAISRVVVG